MPTGIAMPSAGHSTSPRARTVSYRSASSAGSPQAAIQFAESLMSPSARTSAAAMFVIASPTAMRPEAGASSSAMAGRSPSAIASPVAPEKPEVVTATSLTGTCHGPTSGSRLIIPPTLRSPIVTRKPLSAIAGSRRSRSRASRGSTDAAVEAIAASPPARGAALHARRASEQVGDRHVHDALAGPARRPPAAGRRPWTRRSPRADSVRGGRARRSAARPAGSSAST